MKRKLLSILLALCMVICLMPQGMVADAAAKGWTQVDGEWVWLDSGGNKVENTFKLSGSNYYWLNEDGFIGSNELVEYEGDYYYVDETGAMVKSQWVDVENTANVEGFGNTIKYYFQSSGKAYKSGKKFIVDKYYVFDSQGRMLYGWINYSNGVYSMASKNAKSKEWKNCIYYASDNGALVKGSWQQIRVYDGSAFCDYQFYFKANGKKCMMDEKDVATGYSFLKADGNDETKYAFAADGHRMPEVESGTSSESTSKKGWYWDAANEKNYYLGEDGNPLYKNEIKSINGKKYLFDSNGVMLTGLYYLEFDADGNISSKVCLNGENCSEELLDKYTTIGGENYKSSESESKSGVYYFKEPASTAGEMVTGSTTVDVDGDKYSFRFAASGNDGKGLNGISDSYYYVNGRKVKADSEKKYELFECVIDSGKVTKFSSGSNTAKNVVDNKSNTQSKTYALISSTGSIVKSGTKTNGDGYKIKVTDYKVTEIKDENKDVVWPSSGLSTPTATLKVSASTSQGDSTTTQGTGTTSDETATFKYGTDATTIKPSVVFSGGEKISDSNVTYKYGTDINTAADWPTKETPLNVGTYYAWAIIDATDNYAGTTIATSFNVTGSDIGSTNVTAENVTRTYKGEEQEIKVSVTIDTGKITDMTGKKVTYSLTRDGVYTDSLTFTDATNGAQPVYYKITSDNYNEYIGTATVTVNPIVASFDWGDATSVNCTETENIVATVKNAEEGDDFNITYNRTINSAGQLTVTVKSLGNSNYTLPADATGKQKVVSVTHTGTEKYVEVNKTTHHKVYSCCNHETETATNHTFDQQVVDSKYLKSPANCESAAVYYKSCVCGYTDSAKAETFTSGTVDANKHTGELGNWESNDTEHWKKYSCCSVKAEEAAHNGGIATCTKKAVCSKCQAEYGTTLAHTYNREVANSTYLKSAATCKTPAVYYKSCVCGAYSNAANAETFNGTVDSSNHAGQLGEWQYDNTQHWKEYTCCNAKTGIADHTDANSDNKCDTCGKVLVTYSGGASATTDNVTNKTETTATGTEKVTNADISSKISADADGNRTASMTVDNATAEKIVEKAVENKSETVVINSVNKEAAAPATIEVAIPAATVTQLSEKTDAGIAIKTDDADIMLDKQAVAAVAGKVSGTAGDVKITVKKVGEDSSNLKLDVKIETANGEVKDFKGGSMTVTVKLSDELADKELVCVNIDDKGIYHRVKGQKNADKTFTFTYEK